MQSLLLIEDDHDTRVSLRRAFENAGYFVFSSASAIDGLATLNLIKVPSLIILDQEMPIMGGEEFLTIKNRNPEWKDIPVILISGHKDKCLLEGVRETLNKPYNLNQAIELVMSLCPPKN